jgi:polysaccharide export outer membrane protein
MELITGNKYLNFIYCFILIGCLCSCTNTRKATYFNDLPSTEFADVVSDPVLQKDDLLSINVSSINPEATAVFNMPNQVIIQTPTPSSTASQSTGYLVDKDGNINFPILGQVAAAGKTQKQLSQHISSLLTERKLLVDPIINIRLLNFRVTVLGEVARPTVVNVPTGKISFMEALGMAGDMTLYAKRNNVLLVRQEDGKKITRRIDLTESSQLFTSPYYYLQPNDVIYVGSNKTKIASTSNTRQLLPIIISGASLAIIIIDRITR